MKIREDGQKLLKVPQTQHERRKTLRSMKHDTGSFSLSPLSSQDTGGLLWMRFWRGPRETVRGAKGATPWVPSQGSLWSLIIFSQTIYKREPKPKNKRAYFRSDPRFGLLKKTMKLTRHIGWRYFLLESTLLWKNLFSDGPIRKPCTYRGKRIFLLKNLRKRRLLNRRPLSGTTCSLEPDRRPSANINGSKNAPSLFLYFFDHVFLFLHFVLHNLHFWPSNQQE